jgi:hypothetical protein
LKYRGQRFAEVWFKPEGEPLVLIFRIPRESFRIPGIDRQLTIANLLKAVALVPEEVSSWCHGDVSHPGRDGGNPEFRSLLPAPEVAHLDVYVYLKPPPETVAGIDSSEPGLPAEQESEAGVENGEPEAAALHEQDATVKDTEPEAAALHEQDAAVKDAEPESPASQAEDASSEDGGPKAATPQWEELDSRWKAILGLEATIDTLRISLESLMVEMENSLKKTLTMEDKLHAPRADVSQWTKEKKRVLDAIPKVKDAIHRCVWAVGTPERKRLESLYNDYIEPKIPFPEMGAALKELEALQKARQVLFSQGQGVYQESRTIATSVQGALRTLQTNAAANAKRKRDAAKGGKFFKDIRRATGGG